MADQNVLSDLCSIWYVWLAARSFVISPSLTLISVTLMFRSIGVLDVRARPVLSNV